MLCMHCCVWGCHARDCRGSTVAGGAKHGAVLGSNAERGDATSTGFRHRLSGSTSCGRMLRAKGGTTGIGLVSARNCDACASVLSSEVVRAFFALLLLLLYRFALVTTTFPQGASGRSRSSPSSPFNWSVQLPYHLRNAPGSTGARTGAKTNFTSFSGTVYPLGSSLTCRTLAKSRMMLCSSKCDSSSALSSSKKLIPAMKSLSTNIMCPSTDATRHWRSYSAHPAASVGRSA